MDVDERMIETAPRQPDVGRVFSSVRWVTLGQVVSQAVRLAVSIMLARLLTPSDYGLVTMASSFTAIGWLLATVGAAPAIVQRPTVSEGLLRSLATLGLVFGLALWLLLALGAGLIAGFFGEPAVRGVSGSLLGVTVLQYFARNADSIVIGRRLGTLDLGIYEYAYRLYMYPLEVITLVLISVMFPTLAGMQNDRAAMGRAFLRANGAIALAAFPMMIGLAVVADPFVRVALGE